MKFGMSPTPLSLHMRSSSASLPAFTPRDVLDESLPLASGLIDALHFNVALVVTKISRYFGDDLTSRSLS